MTTTAVWQGDQHDVAWEVTSGGVAVDLSGATVRLLAEPQKGDTIELENTFAAGVVTHTLDGTLPVDVYEIVIQVTLGDSTVTYPDAETGPRKLLVRKAIASD